MNHGQVTIAGVLGAIGVGRSRAVKGRDIAARIGVTRLRTVGEVVELLREQGIPICSASDCGYWRASTAEEVEASLRESERRARSMLRQRRLLRAALAMMRGQVALRLSGEAT